MTNDLARWQFATTSIYHFLFVPVTIGLAFLVALLQTAWYRNQQPEYRRLTRFFGVLLTINVAVGVVTGLVQEFEFGMNWSTYSKYVGDVFGGPLAMESLAAFFLESTFLGLWLFGWKRLPKRVHLACIWMVALGSTLSALFILAANSWMQHPVGYKLVHGKPVLNNIGALFTNPTFLWGYVHVILASLVTGALVMLAVSAWHLRKHREVGVFKHSARIAVIVLLPAILIQMFVGNKLGEIEAQYQPVKIAAAEAQWSNCQPCSFSIFQIGGGKNDETPTGDHRGPASAVVPGDRHLQRSGRGADAVTEAVSAQIRAGQLHTERVHPVLVDAGHGLPRVVDRAAGGVGDMAGAQRHAGALQMVSARRDLERGDPVLMNTAGWLLTESGRQPWIVQGLLKTVDANSPAVTSTDIWISLIAFVLVYIALGAADVVLMLRYSRRDLDPHDDDHGDGTGAPAPAANRCRH